VGLSFWVSVPSGPKNRKKSAVVPEIHNTFLKLSLKLGSFGYRQLTEEELLGIAEVVVHGRNRNCAVIGGGYL
jgi:hypothetical protein